MNPTAQTGATAAPLSSADSAKLDSILTQYGHTPTNTPVSGASNDWFSQIKPPAEAPAPKLGEGGAGDMAANVIKTVASPLIRTGGLIESGLDQTIGRVGNAIAGKGFTPTDTGEQAQKTADAIDASKAGGMGGDIGSIIGTIAPYFTGAGEEETAAKVATMLPKLAESLGVSADSLIPKIVGSLARNLPEIAKNFSIGTAQTGSPEAGAVVAGGGVVAKGIGSFLGSLGDKVLNTVIRPTSNDIADGFSINTIKKYNLGGSLSKMYNKTEAKLNDLTQQLNTKLASSPETIDLQSVLKDTVAQLSSNKIKGFGANTSVSSALDQLKGEIGALDKSSISIPEAQLVKQSSGKFGAWQYGMTDPASTARQTVYNAFYRNLKTAIENNSPVGVKGINSQLSELIPVQNAILRRIPVADRNSALSLTDMLGLVGGAIDPRALAGLGISLAQKSGTVGNILSKTAPVIEGAGKAVVPAALSTAQGQL